MPVASILVLEYMLSRLPEVAVNMLSRLVAVSVEVLSLLRGKVAKLIRGRGPDIWRPVEGSAAGVRIEGEVPIPSTGESSLESRKEVAPVGESPILGKGVLAVGLVGDSVRGPSPYRLEEKKDVDAPKGVCAVPTNVGGVALPSLPRALNEPPKLPPSPVKDGNGRVSITGLIDAAVLDRRDT